MMEKRGQQEMVGFVLIVVLVVVAMMVFLIISLRQPAIVVNSKTADNLLASTLSYTTDCVVKEPNYETVRDLISDCYENKKCTNFDVTSCSYLNESLIYIMKDLSKTDNSISAYEINIFWESDDEETRHNMLFIKDGSCNLSVDSQMQGDSEPIYVDYGNIEVRLKICGEI